MDVKVSCACGTDYKFEVEPINKRMPWPVSCPACGADGTAATNEIIRQALTASELPVPVAQAVVPPPSMGLRINREVPAPVPVMAEGAASEAGSDQPPPPLSPSRRAHAGPTFEVERPVMKTAWIGWAVIASVFLVAAVIGFKVVRTISRVSNVVAAINEATGGGEVQQWNLDADNGVTIYVRHTNHMEVAQACMTYCTEKLNRHLRIVDPIKEPEQPLGEEMKVYLVMVPHHGYVRLMAGLEELKDPEFEGLSQYLSQRFDTLVFEQKDVDFSGEFVFGVYEQGTNKFHAQMKVSIQNGAEHEVVKTENNDWALAHGFSGGAKGLQKFNLKDANDITKNCGMKFWDEDLELASDFITLKEGMLVVKTR
ncbi:MAG: Pyrrolo-quinoline quinone [Pedosphaera sp.]|nr:Pyrrolo-quinoline quinone [Pedosphaera sp.]